MRRSSKFALRFVASTCLALGVTACAVGQQLLTCPTATTLDALATCIRNQMPNPNRPGTNLYVPPIATEQADFSTVVTHMMNGACNFALPASLAANYQIRSFTDSLGAKNYCQLMEVLGADLDGIVDKGGDTFLCTHE